MNYNSRIKKVLLLIKKKKLDGFLVLKPANIFYLSGFNQEGFLFISGKQNVLITDARYKQEAKEICMDKKFLYPYKYNVSIYKTNPFNHISNIITKLNIKKIGIESDSISYLNFKKLEQASKGKYLIALVTNIVEQLRLIKDEKEIVLIKKSIDICKQSFEYLKQLLRPGITEKEVAAKLECFIKLKGADKGSFNIIVASGQNSSKPHWCPSNRKFKNEDVILVDYGAVLDGYNSDLTRVFCIGRMNSKAGKIFEIIIKAQKIAFDKIKPYVLSSKIDGFSRHFIKDKGFGPFFTHSLGHGVGLEIHEGPIVSFNKKTILKENMVFTVEPGIYLPDWGGIRVEDMVLVTSKGCEILTRHIPSKLVVV